jgi:hypothetical protein
VRGILLLNADIVIYFWASLSGSGRQRFRTNKCVLLDAVIQTNRRYGTAGKPTSSRNGYKKGYSDEKEGQPDSAVLLIIPLLSD